MCSNFFKKTGFLLFLLLASVSLLPAQESLDFKLVQLEDILMKLEIELLNSKKLLAKQTLQLEAFKGNLQTSEVTIESLSQILQNSRTSIKLLESTITELKLEIETLHSQTSGVSNSLEQASISFAKYERTTKILMGAGGVVILGLIGGLIYVAVR